MNRRHVFPRNYDPRDIVSLDWDNSITYRYNNITINDIIIDDPSQKVSFVKLQFIFIVFGSHDSSDWSKLQSVYTYYSRQRQNQSKNWITAECSCFARLIPGMSRWFTWLEERFIKKFFGGAIHKYVTMVFLQLVITS